MMEVYERLGVIEWGEREGAETKNVVK